MIFLNQRPLQNVIKRREIWFSTHPPHSTGILSQYEGSSPRPSRPRPTTTKFDGWKIYKTGVKSKICYTRHVRTTAPEGVPHLGRWSPKAFGYKVFSKTLNENTGKLSDAMNGHSPKRQLPPSIQYLCRFAVSALRKDPRFFRCPKSPTEGTWPAGKLI